MLLNPGIMWLLIIFAMVVGLIAQWRVTSVFKKYSQVPTQRGRTGAEVADEILRSAGIDDVQIDRVDSFLGDHYDPTKTVLCLSPGVYDSCSIEATGIAAPECGHAFIMIGGFMFGLFRAIPGLLDLGIAVYAILTVFQLITLPVEFDASHRAKLIMTNRGIVTLNESHGAAAVLNAAALTYVAAFLSALFHLLYLVSLRDRR